MTNWVSIVKCLFSKYCGTFTQSVYTYGRNESSCNKLYFARCSWWISARANGRITREEQGQHSLRARYFEFAIIMAFLVKLSISQVIYVDCSSRRASTPLSLSISISVYILYLLFHSLIVTFPTETVHG